MPYVEYAEQFCGATLSDKFEIQVGEAHTCPFCWSLTRSRAKPTVLGSGEQVPPNTASQRYGEREADAAR